MSVTRLLVAPDALASGDVTVRDDGHHYLFRVRRLAVGDPVVLFDGCGREADARVAKVTADEATLAVQDVREVPAPARPALTVLLSLIKGDRTEWAIQKLVELGVDRIVPIRAARSVVKLDGARAASRHQRYATVAGDAARQCRRATVPEVAPIADFRSALAGAADADLRLLLWAQGQGTRLRDALPAAPPARIAVLVGPEGGFTEAEVEAAVAAGFVAVRLGPRILRAETAAVAVTAALGFALGDL